jgi:hypothetical protein
MARAVKMAHDADENDDARRLRLAFPQDRMSDREIDLVIDYLAHMAARRTSQQFALHPKVRVKRRSASWEPLMSALVPGTVAIEFYFVNVFGSGWRIDTQRRQSRLYKAPMLSGFCAGASTRENSNPAQ